MDLLFGFCWFVEGTTLLAMIASDRGTIPPHRMGAPGASVTLKSCMDIAYATVGRLPMLLQIFGALFTTALPCFTTCMD
jgi:hypothetical protein